MNQLKMVHVVLEEGQMVSYHKKIVRFQKIIFKPFTSSHISSEMSRRGRSVMMGVANRAALWLSCGCTPLVEQGLQALRTTSRLLGSVNTQGESRRGD